MSSSASSQAKFVMADGSGTGVAIRPQVVTLCGSTRFQGAFLSEQRRLTLEGKIVISVGLFDRLEDIDMGSAVKVDLGELHKRKIDISDRIHVINVGGYIDVSTRSEIAYAESLGIPVTYMEVAPMKPERKPGWYESLYS